MRPELQVNVEVWDVRGGILYDVDAQGCAWIYWAVDRSGMIGGRMAAIFFVGDCRA